MSAIAYSKKRTITKLAIEDKDGSIVYSYGMANKDAKKEKPKADAPKPNAPQIITEEHAEEIKNGLRETDSNVPAFLSIFQAKSVDEMYEAQYDKAMEMIEKKKAKKKGETK